MVRVGTYLNFSRCTEEVFLFFLSEFVRVLHVKVIPAGISQMQTGNW